MLQRITSIALSSYQSVDYTRQPSRKHNSLNCSRLDHCNALLFDGQTAVRPEPCDTHRLQCMQSSAVLTELHWLPVWLSYPIQGNRSLIYKAFRPRHQPLYVVRRCSRTIPPDPAWCLHSSTALPHHTAFYLACRRFPVDVPRTWNDSPLSVLTANIFTGFKTV